MMHLKSKLTLFLFSLVGITGLHAQTIKDIDGNVYPTIIFGSQTWMKENLKVTRYRNGDPIQTTSPINICNETTPKYQWPYGGIDSLANSRGRLYTWYVVNDERQVCPAGWHVPSAIEWMELRHHLGLDTVSQKTGNEPDTSLYEKLSAIAIERGFATVYNGKRTCGGAFNLQTSGIWWTIINDNNEMRSNLSDLSPFIGRRIETYRQENNGYPVRCVKD